MSESPPIPLDALYRLAPEQIGFYRSIRYDGDGMAIPLDWFAPADRELIARAYRALQAIFELLRAGRDTPEETAPRLTELCRSLGWADLVAQMRSFGQGGAGADPHVARQVIHDLRGGGFQALASYIQIADLGLGKPADIFRMFFLTRDQLKIMRNSVRGLDEPGLRRDLEQSLHSVDLLVEKWAQAEHRTPEHMARVRVESRYRGFIAERCLEFSALDRVLYNLLNNAVRHGAAGPIDLAILPVGAPSVPSLRFVVANPVGPAQRRTLEERFPGGPGALFAGGFTTGGSGLGMRICADFVCNAYGLGGVEQGLAEGHFGAALLDGRIAVWFHWPIAAD